ncbi:MAG: NAD-dependent epimerase/dehydratase family protein, partial [Clostridia bacterium]|nr:NAD-dependent epimerase/dehydratase family protein [Clostridia bacterium]
SGKPMREFLHVDDLADACVFLLENYSDELHINVGTGEEISIGQLAALIKTIIGFQGAIVNDLTKPDGTPRKLLDVGRLKDLGWEAKIGLEQGISETYQWFSMHQDDFRQA